MYYIIIYNYTYYDIYAYIDYYDDFNAKSLETFLAWINYAKTAFVLYHPEVDRK